MADGLDNGTDRAAPAPSNLEDAASQERAQREKMIHTEWALAQRFERLSFLSSATTALTVALLYMVVLITGTFALNFARGFSQTQAAQAIDLLEREMNVRPALQLARDSAGRWFRGPWGVFRALAPHEAYEALEQAVRAAEHVTPLNGEVKSVQWASVLGRGTVMVAWDTYNERPVDIRDTETGKLVELGEPSTAARTGKTSKPGHGAPKRPQGKAPNRPRSSDGKPISKPVAVYDFDPDSGLLARCEGGLIRVWDLLPDGKRSGGKLLGQKSLPPGATPVWIGVTNATPYSSSSPNVTRRPAPRVILTFQCPRPERATPAASELEPESYDTPVCLMVLDPTKSGQAPWRLNGYVPSLNSEPSVVLSPDGTRLLVQLWMKPVDFAWEGDATQQFRYVLLDLRSLRLLTSIPAQGTLTNGSVRFAADGQSLLFTSPTRVQLWKDTQSGAPILEARLPTARPASRLTTGNKSPLPDPNTTVPVTTVSDYSPAIDRGIASKLGERVLFSLHPSGKGTGSFRRVGKPLPALAAVLVVPTPPVGANPGAPTAVLNYTYLRAGVGAAGMRMSRERTIAMHGAPIFIGRRSAAQRHLEWRARYPARPQAALTTPWRIINVRLYDLNTGRILGELPIAPDGHESLLKVCDSGDRLLLVNNMGLLVHRLIQNPMRRVPLLTKSSGTPWHWAMSADMGFALVRPDTVGETGSQIQLLNVEKGSTVNLVADFISFPAFSRYLQNTLDAEPIGIGLSSAFFTVAPDGSALATADQQGRAVLLRHLKTQKLEPETALERPTSDDRRELIQKADTLLKSLS